MVITAQWELVLGNTYAYTVLSAFGFFYGGFGAIITPLFGVKESYGDDVVGYQSALGFWVLSKPAVTLICLWLMRCSVGCLERFLSTWVAATVGAIAFSFKGGDVN